MKVWKSNIYFTVPCFIHSYFIYSVRDATKVCYFIAVSVISGNIFLTDIVYKFEEKHVSKCLPSRPLIKKYFINTQLNDIDNLQY